MRLFASTLLALVVSACASSTPVVAPASPAPDVERPPSIEDPESGFWQPDEAGPAGTWRYDLAVGFVP